MTSVTSRVTYLIWRLSPTDLVVNGYVHVWCYDPMCVSKFDWLRNMISWECLWPQISTYTVQIVASGTPSEVPANHSKHSCHAPVTHWNPCTRNTRSLQRELQSTVAALWLSDWYDSAWQKRGLCGVFDSVVELCQQRQSNLHTEVFSQPYLKFKLQLFIHPLYAMILIFL